MKIALAVACLLCSLTACGQEQERSALDDLIRSAEQGNAEAQYSLGVLYIEGQGVPQDSAEGHKWYRLAAEQGHPEAQWLIGERHRYYDDWDETIKWYRLAAEQGHVGAQWDLARIYHRGDGVPEDYVEAAKWYRLSAELGNIYSQDLLGRMYHDGEGVPQDYVQAHMWFNLLAARRTGDAAKHFAKERDRVAGKMTRQQIAEAQRLAREWKPKTWDELKGR